MTSREEAARRTGLPDAALLVPPAMDGMRIGLFGGSFNPVHEGHLLVAETAMKRLGLDRVWWIVTPGNPLKDHGHLKPIAERYDEVRQRLEDPRFVATAFEAAHRIRYTADTVALALSRRRTARFVWVMGADSLTTFHRWQGWRSIAESVPIAVVDRPGSSLSVLSAPMARRYARFRLREGEASRLPGLAPPRFVFLHGPRSRASSSDLRRACGSAADERS